MAAWQHLIQRNLWLHQTTGISEPMRRQLLECPISPDGLIGPRRGEGEACDSEKHLFTKDGCFLPTQLSPEPTGPAITVSHASPPTRRQAVNKLCIFDRASPTLLSPHHVMPVMTCGETAAKTSSLSTNDTQLVHSVSSLLPSQCYSSSRPNAQERGSYTLVIS